MSERRIWNRTDETLMHEAIERELVTRLASEGKQAADLSHVDLVNRRYRIHQDLMYGPSAEETRTKRASLYAALDAGQVPTLCTQGEISEISEKTPHLGNSLPLILGVCSACGAPMDMHDDGECPPLVDKFCDASSGSSVPSAFAAD